MMHSKETKTVVVICDENKKPLREFQTETYFGGRTTKVYIPFDSEYQFLIKNGSNRRLRISIDIDGSSIGSDIILNGFDSDYLERFISHASKFKFVPLSDNSVADPTSKENGIITVKAVLEKEEIPCMDFYCSTDTTYSDSAVFGSAGAWGNHNMLDHGVSSNVASKTRGIGGQSVISKSFKSNGATTDGAKSNQSFTSTQWKGDDGDYFTFTFQLEGVKTELSAIEKNEIQLLKELKEKYPHI